MDVKQSVDYFKEGTKEVAETTHEKTNEFHDKYISKITPDCGKYGNAATFVAEMVPGVSEYNAIREGDWLAFTIAAGIDVAAIGIGVATAGAGYAAVKEGSAAAKIGLKAATKKVAKETVEAGAKKAVKEAAEAGLEKAAKEVAEAGIEKAAKEVAEAGVEKVAKEAVEAGAEKAAKEAVEAGAEKAAKEIAEKTTKEVAEKTVKEAAETGAEKTAKEKVEKLAVSGTKEVGEKIDKQKMPEYLKEIETITHREIKPIQMEKLQKAIKEQNFVKLGDEQAKLHKRLYNNARNRLIEAWEKNTGEKWPVYAEDVLNDAGEVIRRVGQRYDAHHIIEVSFGGPNEWWNLHPAAHPLEHQAGIHAVGSLAQSIF